MISWISEFWQSLPHWSWILPYAWLTYGGLRLWTGELFGRVSWDNGSAYENSKGVGIGLGLLLNGLALVVSLFVMSGTNSDGTREFFADYSRWVGFQMMAVGAAAFALRTAGDFLWARVPKWFGTAKARMAVREKAEAERRARDPQRILVTCRKRFDEAKREHGKVEIMTVGPDTTELIGFAQAGENLLDLLQKLFKLVARIDAWFGAFADADGDRKRANDIYPDVPLDQFIPLLGTAAVDAKSLEQLRLCAKGEIEGLVLFFERLPGEVLRENIYREANGIPGLQREMDELVPPLETTSSTGVIADLETGKLQERLLERLAQSAAHSTATAPHKAEGETASARPVKVRV